MYRKERDPAYFNAIQAFQKELDIQITHVEEGRLVGEMPIQKKIFAANTYVHAGSIVTLADTVAGFSTVAHLPEEARSFTTLELKTNFVGALREGTLQAESFAEHLGRSTHVWRVEVSSKKTGKKVAVFTCTQLTIYPEKRMS